MRPRYRATDPETSRLAAIERQQSGAVGSHMMTIAQAVLRNPGHTSRELTEISRLERHEVSRRLADCEAAGWVEKGFPRPCEIAGRRMVTWWPAAQFRRLIDSWPLAVRASG